jgi:hypothetical protein
MTNTPISMQDPRRNIYVKAKAEPSWGFWGLYVRVCKIETLREPYALARKNIGAPGVDGVTFEVIEAQGVEKFLEQLRGATFRFQNLHQYPNGLNDNRGTLVPPKRILNDHSVQQFAHKLILAPSARPLPSMLRSPRWFSRSKALRENIHCSSLPSE